MLGEAGKNVILKRALTGNNIQTISKRSILKNEGKKEEEVMCCKAV